MHRCVSLVKSLKIADIIEQLHKDTQVITEIIEGLDALGIIGSQLRPRPTG